MYLRLHDNTQSILVNMDQVIQIIQYQPNGSTALITATSTGNGGQYTIYVNETPTRIWELMDIELQRRAEMTKTAR
ncbi:hypothetical protein [Rhizobium sp. BK661]|uniref:hypothetical protein n=1 Tax=Rhizobium sp. BK661 TaxID=2586991 RepID=UPI0021689AE8|nr:hypothetical protein [Rhizobium sp. BK661]MCS3741979.1 hypothetical protein [Rhizobium sp. BK661]